MSQTRGVEGSEGRNCCAVVVVLEEGFARDHYCQLPDMIDIGSFWNSDQLIIAFPVTDTCLWPFEVSCDGFRFVRSDLLHL